MLSYMKFDQPPPRILTLADIEPHLEELVSLATLNNQSEAFIATSNGSFSTCPIQTCGQAPLANFVCGVNGQTCIKTGYMNGGDEYVTKIAAGGAPGYDYSGMMLIFSQRTLRLDTIILEECVLTDIRTAAAAALGSMTMLGEKSRDVRQIGMIGAGVQARWQLRFLALITPCRRVLINSRSKATSEAFVQSMRKSSREADREWSIEFASPEQIGATCQLIHTATPARQPILTSVQVDDFCHITCVGADTPGKQELAADIVKSADFVVYDHREQVKERGELQHTFDQLKHHCELGEYLADPKSKKVNNAKLTIFDSTGCAAQDAMIAKAMLSIIDGK